MCVTCEEVNGEAYIRAQGNGLPNHCYFSEREPVGEFEFDFSVKFASKVDEEINTIKNQNQLNEKVCDIMTGSDANIPESYGY